MRGAHSQLPNERSRDEDPTRRGASRGVVKPKDSRPSPSISATIASSDFAFTRIVGNGDPMPGLEGRDFLWVNGNFFKALTRMNAAGHVGFAGGWTTGPFPSALFVYRDGASDLVVSAGDPAPGTTSQFEGFPIPFTAAPHIGHTNISFDGSADFIGDLDGVWVWRPGGIDKVFAGRDDRPPGTPPGTHFFQWFHTMARSGNVLLNANFIPPGGTSFNNQGFFRDTGGGLRVVAKTGRPAPGFPAGTVFGNGLHVGLSPFGRWSHDDIGRIAFNAKAMGPTFDATSDEGIWHEKVSGLELIVREGWPVPGAPGAVFRSGEFGSRTFGDNDLLGVLINSAGGMIFGAHMAIDDGFAGTGLFTTRSGSPELVLRANAFDEGPPGDQAPGFPAGQTLGRFRHGTINDNGAITFAALVKLAPGSSRATAGLWVEDDGVFVLVGHPTDPAPLLPGWRYANEELGIMEFTNSGSLYYLARVTDGFSTESVLYMRDAAGKYHIVVMTGTTFDHGVEAKVMTAFVVGLEHSNEDEIAVHIIYEDDSEELFLVGPKTRISVDFDIKPGSCPNPLNMREVLVDPKSGGILTVAVLGTADFDVKDIDPSTLTLEGIEPLRHSYEDVATPAGGSGCDCTTDGPDGHLDLLLKFQEVDLVVGLALLSGTVPLRLTGDLHDGTGIEGVDCVALKGQPTLQLTEPDVRGVELMGAAPNPFNPVTTIHYYLPNEVKVDLLVYDVAGRLVERLVSQVEGRGDHAVQWNARDAASGVYFYKLVAGDFVETRKMLLLK